MMTALDPSDLDTPTHSYAGITRHPLPQNTSPRDSSPSSLPVSPPKICCSSWKTQHNLDFKNANSLDIIHVFLLLIYLLKQGVGGSKLGTYGRSKLTRMDEPTDACMDRQ